MMKKADLNRILLALSLVSFMTGCGNHETKKVQPDPTVNVQTTSSKEVEADIFPRKETNENKVKTKDSQAPSTNKAAEKIWVFADTHTHPYEGTLESIELKGSHLIRIRFKAEVAIITPTNPIQDTAAIGSRMGQTTNYPVRDDKEQSSELTPQEISRLKAGSDFLIIIDDWRNEKDEPVKATDIDSIYYKKGGNYYSVKGDRLFDTCSLGKDNECLRITN